MAEHPVVVGLFVTVVTLGMVVLLAPYVLEILGFGPMGPVQGKFFPIFYGWERDGGG